MSDTNRELVGSLIKGLSVIRAFSAERPSMTLSEVAEVTGLSRASARRFLLTLAEMGYARSQGKRFELTARVLELGFSYLSSLGLTETLTPLLEEVSQMLDESCSAAVLDGGDIVYIARVPASRIMAVRLGIGARLPATLTSLGRVLLAGLPPEDRERFVERYPPAPHTERTVTDPNALLAHLREVERDGYALVDQELEDGLRSIAVPVHDHHGSVIAAINVSGHANRVSEAEMRERYLPALLKASERFLASP